MNYEYLFLFYGSPYMLKHGVCLLAYLCCQLCSMCTAINGDFFFFFLLLTTAIMCFHAAD